MTDAPTPTSPDQTQGAAGADPFAELDVPFLQIVVAEDRPVLCRDRLADEGKPHPKSGCEVAGCEPLFGSRLCDAPAHHAAASNAARHLAPRIQFRIDAALERRDENITIGVPLARELVAALDRSVAFDSMADHQKSFVDLIDLALEDAEALGVDQYMKWGDPHTARHARASREALIAALPMLSKNSGLAVDRRVDLFGGYFLRSYKGVGPFEVTLCFPSGMSIGNFRKWDEALDFVADITQSAASGGGEAALHDPEDKD